MIICSCNVLTAAQVRAAAAADGPGAQSLSEVYRFLGCRPQCGRCARTIRAILEETCAACPACAAGETREDGADAACAGMAGAA